MYVGISKKPTMFANVLGQFISPMTPSKNNNVPNTNINTPKIFATIFIRLFLFALCLEHPT